MVTLGDVSSSSRRDMASSTVVAVALFTQRSGGAIDVSNRALGVYRIGATRAGCDRSLIIPARRAERALGILTRWKGDEGSGEARAVCKKQLHRSPPEREAARAASDSDGWDIQRCSNTEQEQV